MILAQVSKIIPILYAIVGFGLLILVHELGHFIFCKAFNIHTPTFSIGMGPTIFQKKIGLTNFRLAAIPLGGYVEIAGLQEVGQGEQKHAQANDLTAFRNKPYWQKIIVLGGGVSFNLIFAYLLFIFLFITGGIPKTEIKIQSVEKDSPAEIAGILSGDKVIKIGESDLLNKPELLEKERESILSGLYQNIKFTVSRNNETKEITIQIPKSSEQNATIEKTKKGKLGVSFALSMGEEKEHVPFINAIKHGISTTNLYITMTLSALKQMFKQKSLKGVGGPVMIVSQSIDFAKRGLYFLFIFLAMISISLAIMNLLPLPVLDGGQMVFTTIEAIIGRELPIAVKNYAALGSIILLGLLFIYITYGDILFIRGK